MPAILGAVALAVGGLVAFRLAHKEWVRVNKTMDQVRSAGGPNQGKMTPTLVEDPRSGTYRPEWRDLHRLTGLNSVPMGSAKPLPKASPLCPTTQPAPSKA